MDSLIENAHWSIIPPNQQGYCKSGHHISLKQRITWNSAHWRLTGSDRSFRRVRLCPRQGDAPVLIQVCVFSSTHSHLASLQAKSLHPSSVTTGGKCCGSFIFIDQLFYLRVSLIILLSIQWKFQHELILYTCAYLQIEISVNWVKLRKARCVVPLQVLSYSRTGIYECTRLCSRCIVVTFFLGLVQCSNRV